MNRYHKVTLGGGAGSRPVRDGAGSHGTAWWILVLTAILLSVPGVAIAAARDPHRDSSDGATRGVVHLLYAASLVDFVQNDIAPAFNKATGDTLDGVPAGSQQLASEIKAGIQRGDIFISAAPSVDRTLEGTSNGSWVSWTVKVATSPLLLGFTPESRFAHVLETKPWYQAVTQPGFLLGRTDPKVDPKGVLAAAALTRTADVHHDPALAAMASSTAGVFPEETLVGRLQSGQLDAGFFYRVEAVAAGLATVPLTGVSSGATFTVTILNRAPDRQRASTFVSFLLGAKGRALMRSQGLTPAGPPFKAAATRRHLPKAVEAALGG